MDNGTDRGSTEVLGALLTYQQRQVEALERLGTATEAMANDLWSVVAGSMKVTLIYPWASRPDLFRAVLVRSPEEERRLAEALPRFDTAPPGTTMEAWLKSENFKPIEVTQTRLGKHDGMFKARKDEQAAAAAPKDEIVELKLEREIGELKLESEVVELRLERDVEEPKLEPESNAQSRAA